MNTYLNPGDGSSKIEKFLNEMKALFREIAMEQSRLKEDMVEVKAKNADLDTLRRVQDEMRTFTTDSVKEGLGRGESRLEDKLASMRAAILTEVDKTLKARLDEWTNDHIKPLFEQLAKDREEAEKKRRSAILKQWRERAAFATTIVVLLWAIFNPFGNSNDARETGRIGSAIESLNDAVN